MYYRQFQTPTGRLIHSNVDGVNHFWLDELQFQTPTGRLIHSNVSLVLCLRGADWFQTPTGRLIHSNVWTDTGSAAI